jgi:polysaccharide biosynthesis/export protein
MKMTRTRLTATLAFVLAGSAFMAAAGQTQPQTQPPPPASTPPQPQTPPARNPNPPSAEVTTPPAGVAVPSDYVIGAQDVLSIVFWRDKEMSADVTVRPDGKISLPLLNDVQAQGLTPERLRANLAEAASKYIEEPTLSVVIREIHSRNVFITGSVSKPGTYVLTPEMNVLQLIALAGGLAEFANSKNIVVIQNEGGRPVYKKFNYDDVIRQKHVEQNITLKPNDTVVVK